MSCYSVLYIERGRPLSDSTRFRNRLAAFVEHRMGTGVAHSVLGQISLDTGSIVQRQSNARVSVAEWFRKTPAITDVLDGVTAVHRGILHYATTLDDAGVLDPGERDLAAIWLTHVQKVFVEDNMTYRVGNDGIVHPCVDAEFDANRTAAVSALATARFGEARNDFEAAFRHLRNGEGKQAIRMMFPAVEAAAKVLCPGAFSRLMPNEVDQHIRPRLEAKYAGNQPAIDAGRQMLKAFGKRIVASQPYRHGQELQESAEPPQEFVVAHLSAGATFLRWMIELFERE